MCPPEVMQIESPSLSAFKGFPDVFGKDIFKLHGGISKVTRRGSDVAENRGRTLQWPHKSASKH